MTQSAIPHNALVVVANGTGVRFLRNTGQNFKISLTAYCDFKPTHLLDDDPAGHQPPESSDQETDEATFAKQFAKEHYRRSQRGNFEALVLIVDPQPLGQTRPSLHKEVRAKLVREVSKTLTRSTVSDIEKALN